MDPEKFQLAKSVPWALMGGAGVLGRLTYHARQVQLGKRKPFSWVLLWDIPVALCMGWIAFGVASLWKIPWEATVSFALIASYLGPYGLDLVFTKWADWKFGKRTPGNGDEAN